MMSVSSNFYYRLKQGALLFSRTPGGKLSVERLIKTKPAWKKPSVNFHKKPKHLILADWTLASASEEKIRALEIKLEQLRKKGFLIYFWQNGIITKINKDYLEELSKYRLLGKSIAGVIEASSTMQEQFAKEKKLALNQIFVLDDHWVNILLNDHPVPSERKIYLSDLRRFRHYQREEIINYLLQSNPPLEQIIEDEVVERTYRGDNPNDSFSLPVLNQYKTLTLDITLLTTFLTTGSMVIKNKSITAINLKDVEKIIIQDRRRDLNATNLEKLIGLLPSLKTLRLRSKLTGELNSSNLESIETLIIDYEISIHELQLLLTPFSNLKKVNLKYRSKMLAELMDADISLPLLEELTVSKINVQNLQYILANSPNLTRLKIESSSFENMDDTLNLNLPHLEQLQIEHSSITAVALERLFTEFPQLTSLDLNSSTVLADEFYAPNFYLPALEKLDLNGASINVSNLQSMLLQARRLKKINLSNCKNLTDDFTQLMNLTNLEELKLTNANIALINLMHLMSENAYLKILHLPNCLDFDYIYLDEVNLSEIKELSFSNKNETTITSTRLYQFLTKAPLIERLYLEKCMIEDEFQDFSTNYPILSQLKLLVLSDTKIPSNCLQSLLAETEQLEVLNLSNCSGLWPQMTIDLDLEKLRELDLSNSDISTANLKIILANAPQLRKLNLEGCDHVEIDSFLKECLANVNVAWNIKAKNSLESVATIDADTGISNETLKSQRIFYPVNESQPIPEPSVYRLQVYNSLEIKQNPCDLSQAFTLFNENEAELEEVLPLRFKAEELIDYGKKQALKDNNFCWVGRQELIINTEWQAIGSLFPDEELTAFSISPTSAEVEFSYSERDNLYYIRCNKEKGLPITLNFLLERQKPSSDLILPESIAKIIYYFHSFPSSVNECRPITIQQAQPNGYDYLRAIINQKQGACRHRAVAAHYAINQDINAIPVRIVCNDLHAYIETNIQGQWVKYDLGGHPSKIEIKEPINPIQAAKSSAPPNPIFEGYRKLLQTWERKKTESESLLGYCQRLVQPSEIKKRLVELPSSQSVHHLGFALEKYCQSISRPIFYVNSPDDLICSAPFLQAQENKGILKKGPGGRLYNFLQMHQNKANPPILLINYDSFDADDIVRFNGLLDKVRHADGSLLPEEMIVIGLANVSKVDYYQGSDFYSRLDESETCPLSANDLAEYAQEIAGLPFITGAESSVATINLYHGLDWEERLLGQWLIKGDEFVFVEGELQKALKTGLPLEIQNGLWDDEQFKLFWQQARLRGYIDYPAGRLAFPENLALICREGYDWSRLTANVGFDRKLSTMALTLNPGNLNDFFINYSCDNENQSLDSLPGLLENYSNQVLEVNVTRSLDEDEWALFLTACEQRHLQLKIHCAPQVTIPSSILIDKNLNQVEHVSNKVWDRQLTKTTLLNSTDIDTTVSILTTEDEWQVIDVSECEGSDLLLHLHGEIDQKACKLHFQQTEHALLQALKNDKKIILKGHFSENLIDALAPLLLERQNNEEVAKGELVIVSNEVDFSFLPTQSHKVAREEKIAYLEKRFRSEFIMRLTSEQYNNESLSHLKARLRYLTTHPDATDSDDAWQGLHYLTTDIQLPEFDEKYSADIAEYFEQQRFEAVNQILMHSPYVFLTGLTGVGKSTFVKELFKNEETNLYQSETEIRKWAKDNSDKTKVLFLDEANLSTRQWSEFEGLFNDPPGLLIDGEYIFLSKQHKVIFAGNPISYGDERSLASLFARHGNALVFEPMPQEYIYERILKPVFTGVEVKHSPMTLCRPMLDVYRFLCEHSVDKVLISPRELQMIALLTRSYLEKMSLSLENESVAKYYAYQIASPLVPKEIRQQFDAHFKPTTDLAHSIFSIPGSFDSDFLVTPSRENLTGLLNDICQLQQFKQGAAGNDAQRYGGLGGLVVDGAAGIGKSELITYCLIEQGYQEVHFGTDLDNKHLPEKPFYRIPVSMQLDDKKALLLHAFHQGAFVIIDEINSSPMMEEFLNALLMGTTPDGQRPNKPGFFIIGTQNPCTEDGRRAPSTALARRLITIDLPPYTNEEMKIVLMSKELSEKDADEMVRAFNDNLKVAQQQRLKPPPTFRDLIKLAEQVVKGQKAKLELELSINDDQLIQHSAKTLTTEGGFFQDARDSRSILPQSDHHSKKLGQ